MCCLHLDLRVVPYIILHCCVRHLDSSYKGKDTGPQTTQLVEVLEMVGTKISAPEKPVKKLDVMLKGKRAGVALKSYNGNACAVWLQLREIILDITFPVEHRTSGSICLENYTKSKRIWDLYAEYSELLTRPVDYGVPEYLASPDVVLAKRDERAVALLDLGHAFVEAFKLAYGLPKSWYFHAILCHVPDCVRQVGSLLPYSGHAIEQMHQPLKRHLLRLSNSIPGERLPTVMRLVASAAEGMTLLGPAYEKWWADRQAAKAEKAIRRRAHMAKRVTTARQRIEEARSLSGPGTLKQKAVKRKYEG